MIRKISFRLGIAALTLAAVCRAAESAGEVVLNIPWSPEATRNSEGGFVTLKSGRIAFYYCQFSGGASDFNRNTVMEVHSDDQGSTWSKPALKLRPPEGTLSLMVLCPLRLADGRIALAYNQKKSFLECSAYVQFSSDEGDTWTRPVLITAGPGYYTINNDRMIQTRTGRLILPAAFLRNRSTVNDWPALDQRGTILWFLSDDAGATWREAKSEWKSPVPSESGLQEPGAVELADGSLYSWARSDIGHQFEFRSTDGGETWSPPGASPLKSPLSPASIKRLPGSANLLAIYNDYSGRFPHPPIDPGKKKHLGRTPLVAAISTDGGKTWPTAQMLEGDLGGEFHYPTIHFVGDSVLVAYSFNQSGGPHQGSLRIRRLDLASLRP